MVGSTIAGLFDCKETVLTNARTYGKMITILLAKKYGGISSKEISSLNMKVALQTTDITFLSVVLSLAKNSKVRIYFFSSFTKTPRGLMSSLKVSEPILAKSMETFFLKEKIE